MPGYTWALSDNSSLYMPVIMRECAQTYCVGFKEKSSTPVPIARLNPSDQSAIHLKQ